MALKKTIIEPSWEAKYSFSPAVITEGGKTIWLAGHVGFVDDAGASLAGNFDAQVRQAFKNLEKTLQRAGGTLKDIVWMTVAVSMAATRSVSPISARKSTEAIFRQAPC